jgi:hypothetical protein
MLNVNKVVDAIAGQTIKLNVIKRFFENMILYLIILSH